MLDRQWILTLYKVNFYGHNLYMTIQQGKKLEQCFEL